MSLRKRLLVKPPDTGGITPSEHFGVVLYEGDGSSSHSINGGKFGAAAYFNGSNGYISTPALGLVGDVAYSISAWVFLNTSSQTSGIYVIWNGAATVGRHIFFKVQSGALSIGNYGASITASTPIATNQWSNVVVSREVGGSTTLYVNGTSVATGSMSLDLINSSGKIGTVNGSAEMFDGKIDQVRIFTKALSSSEVSTLYAETAATVESLDPLSEDTTDTLQVLGDSSCIATYRFENDETDLSGNYDGTGTAIQYAAGRYGQGVNVNNDGVVTIPTNITNINDHSLSVWFNTSSTSGTQTIFEFDTGNRIIFRATSTDSNKANFGGGGWFDHGISFSANQWYHLVITFKSGSPAKIYVNGNLQYTTGNITKSSAGSANYLGANNASGGNNLLGTLDQFRVFNKELSAAEVTTLYNENSLVASYRFEGNANDDTRNYDGTATNVSYEYGLGFTPDFVWIKERTKVENHRWFDTTRGATKFLGSNNTNAEATGAATLTSFDTGGFTLGLDNEVNDTGIPYVAWCLKANGGTTSSNTDGGITSTVQANTDAGFSIIKYTATASGTQTVGHGLGVAPELIIQKKTSGSEDWYTYIPPPTIDSNYNYLVLNSTAVAGTTGSTVPTSSVFNPVSQSGDYIAYAFKSIDGFSKIGTYTGNADANGPIVETGFEPAFLMIKGTSGSSATTNWSIFDNKRNLTNPRDNIVWANKSDAESNFAGAREINFYSNGFQPVSDGSDDINDSSTNYIYMAFAADPDTEAPTVAKSFSTVTWTGNATDNRTITGLGFQPNMVWYKTRTAANDHNLSDSIRGAAKQVRPNRDIAEVSATDQIKSFDSDGFTVGTGGDANASGADYVAWAFKADDNEPTILPNTELSSLISKYKFEDNANDDYGDNNGTASNLSYVAGRFGKAADFNGTSSKILYPQAAPFNDSNTILAVSAWVKLASTTAEFALLSASSTTDQSDVAVLYVGGANKWGRVYLGDAPSNANEYQANFGSTNNTNWNHFVWQLSATNGIELWVNGVSQTRTQTWQTGTMDETKWFGDLTYATDVQYATGLNRVVTTAYYEAEVDQMRLFNAELTSSEISDLYNEGIEALVSANANAGFSIVKWTGNGSAGKIPHGLSAAPEMIITKRLTGTSPWYTYNAYLNGGANPAYYFVNLNTSDGETSNGSSGGSLFNSTPPTSTIFNIGTSLSGSGDEYIAYCFHSVAGYSKFGSYTGTAGALTVTTGFQPDFLMVKNTTTAGYSWYILDSVRGGSGGYMNRFLAAESSQAETEVTNGDIDVTFTSTGFQYASTMSSTDGFNKSGDTYIYMAFKIN